MDSRCLSQKSELVSPQRQMSDVLGPCGLWTEHSSQGAGVFTRIKEEMLYLEITDSCASSRWHTLVQMSAITDGVFREGLSRNTRRGSHKVKCFCVKCCLLLLCDTFSHHKKLSTTATSCYKVNHISNCPKALRVIGLMSRRWEQQYNSLPPYASVCPCEGPSDNLGSLPRKPVVSTSVHISKT